MSSNKDMVNVKDMSIEKDFKESSNVKDTSSEDTSNATMQVPTPSMLDEKSKEQDFLTQIIRMAVREAVLKMLREEYVKHSNVDDFIKQFFQRRMALKGPGIIGSKMNALKMSKTIAKRADDDEQVKQKFAELERRVGILELNMKNLFNSRENLLKLTSNVRTQMDMVKSLSEELAKGCESISDVRPPGELFQSSTDVTIVCSQTSDVHAIDKLESDKPDNSDNLDKHNHKSKDHSEHKKNKVRGKGLHKSEATINLSGSSIPYYRPKSKSPRKDCASVETLELLHHACSSDIKERVSFIPGKHLEVAKKGVQEKLQLDNSQIPQVSTEISDELMAIYRNDIKEFSQILQTMFSNSFHSFASDKFNEREEDTRRVGSNYYQPNFVNSSNFGNISMTPDNSDVSDNSDSNENSTTDLFENFNGYQTSSQKIANLSSILQRSAENLATIQSMADMLEKHRADVAKNAKDAAQGSQETKKNSKELSNIADRSVSTSFLSLQNEVGASISSTSLVRSRCWDKKELEKRLNSKQKMEVLDEKCKLLESNFGQLDIDSDKNKAAKNEKLNTSVPEEYKAYTENMAKLYATTCDVATQTDGVTKISTVESGQQTLLKETTKDFQQQTEPAACIARATGQQARGLLDGIFMLASEKNMREMIGDNTNKEVFLLNKQRKPSPASELSNKNMKNLKATCKILIGKPHNE